MHWAGLFGRAGGRKGVKLGISIVNCKQIPRCARDDANRGEMKSGAALHGRYFEVCRAALVSSPQVVIPKRSEGSFAPVRQLAEQNFNVRPGRCTFVCALHSLSRFIGKHAAHTCWKLLKKFKNTNKISGANDKWVQIFRRV